MSLNDPFKDFRGTVRLFPLPNLVLFPSVIQPLHIFEPRYRQMTEAALAGDAVIGMVLLRPDADAMAARAPIFEIGCAGRIVEHRKLDDGRFHFLLYGERRFRIERELESRALYREVEVALLPDPAFSSLAPSVQRALDAIRVQLEARMLELVRLSVPESVEPLRERMRALDPLLLTSAIAFGLDGPTLEKQSLLESADALARAELLLRVLEFRIAEARLPDGPKTLN